ncbi:matrixin family metalloprotease [Arthrobacter sp. UKPF54-2]|uniref:matrixin family metalloprotease n=1 Tax=Arthrobacter sp. UKPF54-2 TaxID=2600159 RepID=UPI0011B12998|nr:matrixin family metalloprotease [Arthrobacter sp. UKPF54-2]QDY89129.1 matrixin family metalloprotease [Arthrobacter sp. UKPF54-2]
MDDPGFPERGPRHSRVNGAFRAVRNLAVVVLIAGAAFLTAGLVYGDPRFVGLFDSIGGANPHSRGPANHPTAVPGGRQAGVPEDGTQMAVPPPGFEEQDQPLGQPRKTASDSTSYKFLATNADGSPVGYSPCRPLHYVVNAALAPKGAEQLVEKAIKTVSEATGIKFVNDGPTTEVPSQSRAPYQKEAYGDRWAPLLIAWTTPEQAPQLQGPVIGTGGSTHFSFGDGPKSFVTGSLELDAPQISEDLGRGDGSAYATAVILHELGHVMGLEHVEDPKQLMYPEIGAPDGLADGDLNGLHELGRAACRKDL